MRIAKGRTLAVGLTTGTMILVGAGVVLASAPTDKDITPANSNQSAALKKGSAFKGSASVDHISATISCKSATFTFTTPATGYGPMDISTPVTTSCKDNFGGTDTVTPNNTNGSWSVTLANTKTKNGGTLEMTIPTAGATFTSTLVKGCTGILSPTGPTTLTGVYNDKNQVVFTSQKVAITGSGCSVTGTAKVSATFVFSPGFAAAP
jgi:hypothetical protein